MKAIYIIAGMMILLVLAAGCEKTAEPTEETPETGEETEAAEQTGEEETEQRTAEQNKALIEQLTQEAQEETEDEETEEEPETLLTNVTVVIENFRGDPDDFNVSVGATVTWLNNMPNFKHVIGIRPETDSGSWGPAINEHAEIIEGESFSWTFTETGTYEWYSKTKYPATSGIIEVKEG